MALILYEIIHNDKNLKISIFAYKICTLKIQEKSW